MKKIKMKMNSMAILATLLASPAAFADSLSCDVPKNPAGQELQGQPQYGYDDTNSEGGAAPVVLWQIIENSLHTIGTMKKTGQPSSNETRWQLGNIEILDGGFDSGVDGIPPSTITVTQNGVKYTADCKFIPE